jgi:hypothetical protein
MQKAELRTKVVNEFKSLVFGPRSGKDEFIQGDNNRVITLRYLTGILFPKNESRSDLAEESESFTNDDQSSESKQSEDFSGDQDNPLSMANEELPSSVGITFVLHKNESFNIECSAARYEKITKDLDSAKLSGYQRLPFEKCVLSSENIDSSIEVFDTRAKIYIYRRKSQHRKNLQIITVSLVNMQINEGKGRSSKKNLERRLYQVSLKCHTPKGEIQPYDFMKSDISNDPEENILSLQYSDSPVYAIGHGASVDWMVNYETNRVDRVEVTYIPTEIVKRPIFDRLEASRNDIFSDQSVFDIGKLASENSDKDQIITGLEGLCLFYKKWIKNQEKLKAGKYSTAEDELIQNMSECSIRIEQGIKALKDNKNYWEAFVLANRAMLYQILQNQIKKKLRLKREKEGKVWPIDWHEHSESKIDLNDISDAEMPKWRPFQLAFFLMSFLDLEEEGRDRREIADLIWFSTGGGKTEAYLFLSCYELIRRRTRYASPEMGYGAGVLTRYTLRFLTSDQFTRTASLGCALEKIRINNLETLGEEPFTVGLFGGKSVSYNKISDAKDDLIMLQSSPNSDHLFVLKECPDCGTGLFPRRAEYDDDGQLKGLGVSVGINSVTYSCQNKNCLFHDKLNIPVKVVDQEIYQNPPSFILGTIDKFALLPWYADSGSIFGSKGENDSIVPPTLIIQDEIHLISGPLGTISAIYEAAFDTLIRKLQKNIGLEATGPKYIASSATVRDSEKQLLRLLGRDSKIFPPRGLRINDSFFANTDENVDNGRMYLGIMPQGWRSTSAAHVVSGAFLQSVRYIAKKDNCKSDLDFLWTTLCYCNSKRELGLINSAVNQEIIDRMKVSSIAQGLDPNEINQLVKEEISADMGKSISEVRDSLLTSNNDDAAIDFVPSTNMISVGIDIDRLGSMIVNGQPKSSSEYIQASSRVGRNPDNIGPGVVIALYSPAKPRDRSHYEQFKSYHQTFYRLVEPTSVTPGCEPALSRALHAALVSLFRHAIPGMRENDGAKDFTTYRNDVDSLLVLFKDRLLVPYSSENYSYEKGVIEKHITLVMKNWEDWCKRDLYYNNYDDRSISSLLIGFGDKNEDDIGFRTMWSMRNVDTEVKIDIR